jgi:hypothetical protein
VRLLIQLRTKGVAKESPPVCVLCVVMQLKMCIVGYCDLCIYVLHERRAETMNSGGVSVVTLSSESSIVMSRLLIRI